MNLRIRIVAIGKAKASPEQGLYSHYIDRLPWPITLKEFEDKKPLEPTQRKRREGELLLSGCEGADRIVALDERGKTPDSVAFAKLLSRWRDDGLQDIAFVIGGSDGLSDDVLKRAHYTLSLGAMVWPHLLVRSMLAEQLYRAYTIQTGHPYHRI